MLTIKAPRGAFFIVNIKSLFRAGGEVADRPWL